ncbi:MAG: acyl-ACP--UDP-N-acetylglucosamine O-acyltransferase [Gammaproteobacteria bacterium]
MIHPSAIVDPGVKLGDGVEIGAYAVIGAGVELGDRCRVGSHAVIKGPTRIGSASHIYPFCSIGDDPQDKKYAGEETRLEIGERNTIRESCTINRGTAQDLGVTRIGDDNWIMAYVHIAHDCVVGNDNVLANNVTLAGHVRVGDCTVLGGFVGVHQFCQIGSFALCAMFSGVTRDVPAYITVSGQPAEPRGINSEGLKRRDFDASQIGNIRWAYKTLYRSGLKFVDAVEAIASQSDSKPELEVLLASLRASRRSVVR